jgi:hypothetical protein
MMFGVVPQWMLLLLGGSVGGLLGWRVLRARVWHSLYDDAPMGMSRQQYGRRQRRMAHLKTAFRTILCAAAGMLIVWSVWH